MLRSRVVRAVQIGIIALLGLNTFMGCQCGESHDVATKPQPVTAEALATRPVVERAFTAVARSSIR